MLKYGRSALVSELSGTLGQVGPRQNPEPEGDAISVGEGTSGARPLDLSSIPSGAPIDQRASHERRSRGSRRRAVRRAAAAHAPISPVT
jgi:hypothetical protein